MASPPPPANGEKNLLPSSIPIPSRTNSPQSPPPAPTTARNIAQWGINWRTPTAIAFLFLLGTAACIGHYAFYNYKNGTEATRQEWTIRSGSYLAYIFALSLAATVGLARDQWLWYTLRNDSYTLKSINAMFGVTSNPLNFFNLDMLGRAKISTIMALAKWLLPLATVLTPGTISVVLQQVPSEAPCTVPSLKFDYDNATNSERLPLNPLTCNYLSELGTKNVNPSPRARQIFMMSALSGQITPADNPTPADYFIPSNSSIPSNNSIPENNSIPGNNLTHGNNTEGNRPALEIGCSGNCSYSIQFDGPSVSCTEIIPFSLDGAPWDTQYSFPGCSNESLSDISIPVFRAQRSSSSYNSLWILQSIKNETGNGLACRKPHAYKCNASVSRYTVNLTVSSNEFLEPNIIAVDHLYNINNEPPNLEPAPYDASADTFITADDSGSNVVLTSGTGPPALLRRASVESSYQISSQRATLTDSRETRYSSVNYTQVTLGDTSNYPNWALFGTLLQILEGQWSIASPGITSNTTNTGVSPGWHYKTDVNTTVGSTSLIGDLGEPVPFLDKAIEKMAQRMVVSLLSDRSLVYAANTPSICYSSKLQNTYKFNPPILIITYAVALGVASIMVALGAIALWSNGVASDASFSSILLATRNSDLDKMAEGGCFGPSPLPKAFKGVKLQFGDVLGSGEGQVGHVAIGVNGALAGGDDSTLAVAQERVVTSIKRGGNYY